MLELLCLCVCPIEDWNEDCGHEEALHSNVGLLLPVKGDQFGRGIKRHLVKTV